MADDAGALLVRSGLVSSSALEAARAKASELGGTIGEQLVAHGAIDDDALTSFYKQRLLVPQVNPNTLARLPAKVVAVIPSEMAIGLRAIPVSLDGDNNLTVAMGDPADRHAVDEIAFFTGAYVVRAVATQLQIAWCLAHYYGHVTQLGERLLDNTGKIEVARHQTIAPGESLDVRRPSGEILDKPRDTEVMDAFEDSGPVVTIEELGGSEASGPVEEEQAIEIEAEEGGANEPVLEVSLIDSKPIPRRRRPAKEDPPELAARAGEVQLATGAPIRKIDLDGPRIIVEDDLAEDDSRLARQVSGEVRGREHSDRPPTADEVETPSIFIELGKIDTGPIIYEELEEAVSMAVRMPAELRDEAAGEDSDDVVVLHPKRGRPERRDRHTQLGIGVVPARTGVPDLIEGDATDATRFDAPAAPAGDDEASGEVLAAPPGPHVPGGRATPPPSGSIQFDRVRRAPSEPEDEDLGKPTSVMSAVELDEVIPERRSDVFPAHLDRKSRRSRPQIEDTDDDDEWGPPGTTIPPPLLGAIPGAITPARGIIPIPDVDSAPLLVAPPTPPERGARAKSASEVTISRALESATSRVLELIHTLDHTTDRDQIIAVMIAHLAESHRRAGFFAMRGNNLSLFAITPRISVMPAATLLLDRPSTLQDVVDTRLPYRGPMLDDASRAFLTATLGACPPEILLVPITVKERVVGVLFGDQRVRHTFDDQLALAARAAGVALEGLLKARRR